MDFIWIVVIGIVIYLVLRRKKKDEKPTMSANQDEEHEEVSAISEEAVFKVQGQFEEHLLENYLPDAVSGQEIYTYRSLMRPWYQKLSAQHRYDDIMTQKLRNDWLDYMHCVEKANTYNMLAFELEDKDKQESYREKCTIAMRTLRAIEDGFASAVGKEAIEELTNVREKPFRSFNENGEMAPVGKVFDLGGELVADKN